MKNFQDLIKASGSLVNYSIGLLVAIGLLIFLWGLSRFIMNLGSESKVEEGKNIMKWGLISLFVMVSVWGIIGFFQRSFQLPNTTTNNAPAPGLLPSRNIFVEPGNQPQPGVLPSNPLNLPGSYEPFK